MTDAPTAHESSTHVDQRAESALAHWPSHARFWLSAGGLLALDLWTKRWAFGELNANEFAAWWPGVIHFHRSLNDGAVFGSFTGQTTLFIVASLFALVFVLYLFACSWRNHYVTHIALGLIVAGAAGNLYDRAVVKADVVRFPISDGQHATIIGVIVDQDEETIAIGDWPDGGNVHEIQKDQATVRHQGVVRDFIKFVPVLPAWVPKYGGRDAWPWVFNIADASLVCGVIILFTSSWFERKRPR